MRSKLLVLAGLLLIQACASFYEVNWDFNREFEQGNLDRALNALRDNKQYAKGTARFLYHANNGLLLSMMGKYQESNEYFERAYLFGEDFRVNYAFEAASYLTNPQITVYRGEDHEHLMVLYYKALNFLKQQRYEEALVECKRLNIRLQQLSDKYNAPKKYQRDAFIHNLMGIIYQTYGDWNNAFIAYRNAVEIYETDYAEMFDVAVPEQLKYDVIRAAIMTGFDAEAEFFKNKFNMHHNNFTMPDGELVFFWHNGLTPIKDEFSINFAVNHASGDNLFVFSNENQNMAMSFPFNVDEKEESDLSDLEVFRVAFPRYVERPTYYASATLTHGDSTYALQLGENVNRIAFYSLQQRMLAEFSKTLVRAALKKAAEHSLRKENEGWGALLGMVNAMTEKADTRNWQTLPHSIYYARVPLHAGKNEVRFDVQTAGQQDEHQFIYTVKKGETLFHTFTSLESLPPRYP